MDNVVVLSLGGSIVAPGDIDVDFINSFKEAITSYLEEDVSRKLIIVTGGGAPARIYQNALKQIQDSPDHLLLDDIGIAATRLNAALIREYSQPIVTTQS